MQPSSIAQRQALGAMIRHKICVASKATELGIDNMAMAEVTMTIRLVAQWASEYGVDAARVCSQTSLPLQ